MHREALVLLGWSPASLAWVWVSARFDVTRPQQPERGSPRHLEAQRTFTAVSPGSLIKSHQVLSHLVLGRQNFWEADHVCLSLQLPLAPTASVTQGTLLPRLPDSDPHSGYGRKNPPWKVRAGLWSRGDQDSDVDPGNSADGCVPSA